MWYNAVRQSDTKFTVTANVALHKYSKGNYKVHTYAVFPDGRMTFQKSANITVNVNVRTRTTLYNVFGTTRSNVINYLESNKSSFLGTMYGGGAYDTPLPGVKMQCTGFVWYVLDKTATKNKEWVPCSEVRRSSRYWSPTWTEMYAHFGGQGAFELFSFGSKQAMLSSGVLEKGDIITVVGTEDVHYGFFWGNTSSEDKMWHSKGYGAEYSTVYAGSNGHNKISGIEACGTGYGYIVLKLE